MGRIQSSVGLITGTDIIGTVDQLIAISGQPRDRLVARTNSLQQEQQALAELTASVIGVQLAGNQLGNTSLFRSKAAQSSDSSVLSAEADGAASSATHVVRTIRTAATHAVDTLQRFDSAEEPLGLSGTLSIHSSGFHDDSTRLSELNNGRGIDLGRFRITDRSGQSAEIDLSSARTIDNVLTAINEAPIGVFATTEGDALKLVDQTGQSVSNLVLEQIGTDETLADLGLWGTNVAADSVVGRGLTFEPSLGSALSELRQGQGIRFAEGNDIRITLSDGTIYDLDLTSPDLNEPTLNNLVDELNRVEPDKFLVDYSNRQLVVTDLTGGDGEFSISDAAGSTTASDLGIASSGFEETISTSYRATTIRGTALDDLGGGDGIGPLTSIDVRLSDGSRWQIDVSDATTTSEVIDTINAAGLPLTARLTDSQTGIRLRDHTDGSRRFRVTSADDTAQSLGIAGTTNGSVITGESLYRQIVAEDTLLADLNRGQGVSVGSFTITDSHGSSSAINLAVDGITTVGGLINKINSLDLDVEASINDNGNGIAIVDSGGGPDLLTISDTGSGTTAADLGIAGVASDQTVGETLQPAIIGSESDQLVIESDDSLATIAEKINSAGRYTTASVELADDGTFFLRIRSTGPGESGRFGVESHGFDIGLATQSRGADALIAVSTDGGKEQLYSSADGVFQIDADAVSRGIRTTTLLSEINDGAGMPPGSFTITDSAGNVGAINTRVSEIESVGDLIETINALGIGVSASLNDAGNGLAIVDTAAGPESLSIADVGNGTAAASLGIAGTATEQTVDGALVSALVGPSTDEVAEQSSGLVLTLKELSDDPITVTVQDDSDAIVSAAQSFVDQYNLLIDKLESLTFFNPDTDEVGLLFGSSEALRISSTYTRLLSGVITSAGELRSTAQVGIRFNDQGRLEFSSGELTEALESSQADVEAFFTTETTGLADRLDNVAERIAGESNGLLLNRGETLSTQIQSNNRRIESFNERLERERERLLRQFIATEEAIAKIQADQSIISQIQPITIPTST